MADDFFRFQAWAVRVFQEVVAGLNDKSLASDTLLARGRYTPQFISLNWGVPFRKSPHESETAAAVLGRSILNIAQAVSAGQRQSRKLGIRQTAHYRGVVAPLHGQTFNLPGSKKVTISNLTPDATGAFQIRAMGRLGYTNWSDPITFICG